VLEPDLEEIAPSIEDGDVINPHGMDPATVPQRKRLRVFALRVSFAARAPS